MNKIYINCCCRKCNKMLSFKQDYDIMIRKSLIGYSLPKEYHNCEKGITEDEHIFADIISYTTKKPLGKLIEYNA